jgi:hypothetical protein
LLRYPKKGKPGRVAGTREWIVCEHYLLVSSPSCIRHGNGLRKVPVERLSAKTRYLSVYVSCPARQIGMGHPVR